MGYEIDFIAVGDGTKSGDAIAIRYGNLFGARAEQMVVVVDGGTKESGEALVRHVRKYYATNEVDWVVSTHPDCDHVSGLKVVVENMDVRFLLMHKPWDRASELRHTFRDSRFTTPGLASRLQSALATASELQDLAEQKRIPIYEPFAGVHKTDGSLLFLGPTEEYYNSLVCQFASTPAAKAPPGGGLFTAARAAQNSSSLAFLAGTLNKASSPPSPFESILAAYMRGPAAPPPTPNLFAALTRAQPKPSVLTDEGETSPANNSSAIILLQLDGDRILLTADAGVPALERAADYAASRNILTTGLGMWQVPHHGSEHNLGPTILRRIGGAVAFVSAARCGAPKHPSRRVTNALISRGTRVYSTCGSSIRHCKNAPERPDYLPLAAMEYSGDVGA